MSQPKFLGLIGYQISLAMELRWLALPAGSATNYSRLSWCCFSSRFVVPQYPSGLGYFDDDLFVDQPKNRSVANIVVLLFEALYTITVVGQDTLTADFSIEDLQFIFFGLQKNTYYKNSTSLEKMPLFYR